MRLSEIRGIERLDPNVTRAYVVHKSPNDVIAVGLKARRFTDDDVRALNSLGARVAFFPEMPYPISCIARLDTVPQILTEEFIQKAGVEAVDFRGLGSATLQPASTL